MVEVTTKTGETWYVGYRWLVATSGFMMFHEQELLWVSRRKLSNPSSLFTADHSFRDSDTSKLLDVGFQPPRALGCPVIPEFRQLLERFALIMPWISDDPDLRLREVLQPTAQWPLGCWRVEKQPGGRWRDR